MSQSGEWVISEYKMFCEYLTPSILLMFSFLSTNKKVHTKKSKQAFNTYKRKILSDKAQLIMCFF